VQEATQTDQATVLIPLTSGGRAWAWRELRWQDDFRRAHVVAMAEPTASLERLREIRRRERDVTEGIPVGPEPEITLSRADIEEAADFAFLQRQQELAISLSGWENVRDPRTQEQLSFPDDLGRLSKRDGDELIQGCRRALAEGAPDPNAGGGPSGSGSPTTSSPSTLNGRRSSRKRG